jgi:hypothetical protein
MKRLSLFALSMILGVSAASAQYRAGTNSIGGTFDFEIPDAAPSTLTIAPSFSHSLSEKLAIGAELLFMGEGETRSYGIAPFVRGNLKINDRVGAFARGLPVYVYMDLGGDLSSSSFGIGADAGLYYWISQRFSVELTLANVMFLSTTVDFDGTEVYDGTNFSGSLSPADASVSVFYHF